MGPHPLITDLVNAVSYLLYAHITLKLLNSNYLTKFHLLKTLYIRRKLVDLFNAEKNVSLTYNKRWGMVCFSTLQLLR